VGDRRVFVSFLLFLPFYWVLLLVLGILSLFFRRLGCLAKLVLITILVAGAAFWLHLP
jgi:hypothetical protein